jgi:hypothetical protein
MRFDNGLAALLFFIEKQDFSPYENAMMAKILNDGGHGLQYDANSHSITPWWSDIIDTLADMEKILRRTFSRMELRFLLAYTLNHREGLQEVAMADPISLAVRTPQGRRKRYLQMTLRLERALGEAGYMRRKALAREPESVRLKR